MPNTYPIGKGFSRFFVTNYYYYYYYYYYGVTVQNLSIDNMLGYILMLTPLWLVVEW